jgi:anti-sigma regulatory factor (Ser/Thr protein kinase)
MTRAITLKIPHQRPYHGVARLVVGGLAARLDLSYEHLEDLQLALASILEDDAYVVGPEIAVELDVGDDALTMLVGPLNDERLRTDLETEDEEGLGLGRLLGTLVDVVAIEKREGLAWLRLEKQVRLVPPAGSNDRVS